MTKEKVKKEEKYDNEVPCIYDSIPKEFLTTYRNPCFKQHLIEIPFRMLIVGSSGAGKTQLVVFLLSKMKDTFGNIKIFTRNRDEAIYKYLEKKIPSSHLQIYEGLKDLPNLAKDKNGDVTGFDKKLQHLVIFDDLVLEHDQSKIAEYFIRARKIAKGVSLMYLTQSYFKTPKTIRINLNYVILKKLSSTRDLNLIMGDYNLGVTKEKLLEVYKYSTNAKTNFLLLDLDNVSEKRFRHNLLEVIDLEKDLPAPKPVDDTPQDKQVGSGLMDKFLNKDLNANCKKYLKIYGDIPITRIIACRNKVNSMITTALNTFSGQDYDTLYHLGLIIQFQNGKQIILEKNASVNITDKFTELGKEVLNVPLKSPLTLNTIINNTRQFMKDKFIPYNANSNNCQNFIMGVLQSNNILNDQLERFIKQDTGAIFQDNNMLKKTVNTFTDLGGVADAVINGSGVVVHKIIY